MSKLRKSFAVWVATLSVSAVWATDPPDSAVNPQSGYIESVDALVSSGNLNVRFTLDPGPGHSTSSAMLTSNTADDDAPRLEISASGDTWVVWWRNTGTPQIRVRKHTHATNTWGSDRLASSSSEASRRPELVLSDGTPWIAYEVLSGSSTSVAVLAIEDEPQPIGVRTVLRTTTFGGDVDTQIHALTGHLWSTWVDDATHVGWSEYDATNEAWSNPSYESFANDSVAAARGRIASSVTGN